MAFFTKNFYDNVTNRLDYSVTWETYGETRYAVSSIDHDLNDEHPWSTYRLHYLHYAAWFDETNLSRIQAVIDDGSEVLVERHHNRAIANVPIYYGQNATITDSQGR